MSDVAPPPDEVYLIVKDRTFGGWENIRVARSVEAVAGAFVLQVTDRWADLREPWPIYAGDECSIKFGTETVISGYVDSVEIDLDGNSHTMTVTGRDRAGDVVDCSATGTMEFRNQKLEAIAKSLCDVVGVGIWCDINTGPPLEKFSVNPGDTILDTLARAAKGKRVLLRSSAQGLLHITKAGIEKVPVTLKEGENILSIKAVSDMKNRYSKVVVYGQPTGEGNTTTGIRGEARDRNVPRYRPLIILAEDAASQAYVNARAAWETKTRAGKAVTVTVTVQGWRTPDKKLWRPNTTVNVVSPSCRVNGSLVIAEIEYSYGDDGAKTTMTLKRQDAYTDEVDLPTNNEPIEVASEALVRQTRGNGGTRVEAQTPR